MNTNQPLRANVILRRFKKDTPESSHSDDSSTSVYSGDDWLKIDTLVRGITKDEGSRDTKKIRRSLHHENSGLKEVLKTQKKHKKKSSTLDLHPDHGGAAWYSPKKMREARHHLRVKRHEKREEEHRKLMVKEQRHAQKLEREREAQEKRAARERERRE
ncbi:hypothetical protein EJ07DRAFT_151675 [Lizonia empirigonia]|nr:hypothetical protein EJ07DRAFT_151675 [Lizonia empirigonia]